MDQAAGLAGKAATRTPSWPIVSQDGFNLAEKKSAEQ
jgi:hypothetical protein